MSKLPKRANTLNYFLYELFELKSNFKVFGNVQSPKLGSNNQNLKILS